MAEPVTVPNTPVAPDDFRRWVNGGIHVREPEMFTCRCGNSFELTTEIKAMYNAFPPTVAIFCPECPDVTFNPK